MTRQALATGLIALTLGALIGCATAGLLRVSSTPFATVLQTPPAGRAPIPPLPEGVKFSATPQEPPSTPDLLPAGVPAVYAFYNLPDAARGGVQGAAWSMNGKRLGAIPASDLRPEAHRADRGVVTLRAPTGKLQPGFYELALRGERRTFRASFAAADNAAAILSQPAPADAALSIPQHTTALGVGSSGEPLRATGKVGGKERVYYVLRYEGAEPGMAISIRWWRGTTELKAARREVVLPSTSGWANAWVQSESGLPPGAYSVSAMTSGDPHELARDQFAVR